MSNVIDIETREKLAGDDFIPITADEILQRNLGALRDVIVIGLTEDGTQVFSSSLQQPQQINWLLDLLKFSLLHTG
jgi:hypothetical protein